LGRQVAEERGIAIIGTLGILDDAADQDLINLAEVIAQLQQTNFRVYRCSYPYLSFKEISRSGHG
jgi:predicted nucleic acid-binding protein